MERERRREEGMREAAETSEEGKKRRRKSRTQVGVGFVCNARAANTATSLSLSLFLSFLRPVLCLGGTTPGFGLTAAVLPRV